MVVLLLLSFGTEDNWTQGAQQISLPDAPNLVVLMVYAPFWILRSYIVKEDRICVGSECYNRIRTCIWLPAREQLSITGVLLRRLSPVQYIEIRFLTIRAHETYLRPSVFESPYGVGLH